MEPRELCQERHPQQDFEPPTDPGQALGDPEFDEREDPDDDQEGTEGEEALLDQPEVATEVERTAEEDRVEDAATGGQRDPQGQDDEGEDPAAQEPNEFAARVNRAPRRAQRRVPGRASPSPPRWAIGPGIDRGPGSGRPPGGAVGPRRRAAAGSVGRTKRLPGWLDPRRVSPLRPAPRGRGGRGAPDDPARTRRRGSARRRTGSPHRASPGAPAGAATAAAINSGPERPNPRSARRRANGRQKSSEAAHSCQASAGTGWVWT